MRKKVTNAGFFSDIDPKKRVMYQEFVMPPFSVLDARSGEWIKRKNLWLTLGLRGELGRMPSEDDKYNVAYRRTLDKFGGQLRREYDKKNAVSKLKGNIDDGKFNELDRYDGYENTTGVSVFDPVLCELMYRWFCPSGGMVLDPFAGGATRGIVATTLGFDYTGVEIRADQVEENEKQASNLELHPVWLVGDSYKIDDVLQNGFSCDFLFTCPPYYDREI
jgi:DNA modification methylase